MTELLWVLFFATVAFLAIGWLSTEAGVTLALVLLTFTMLGACATRQHAIELGVGYDRQASAGSPPQSVIRYRNEPLGGAPGWVLEYDHHSSIRDGRPFNQNKEDTADQISIIRRWVF